MNVNSTKLHEKYTAALITNTYENSANRL